MIYNVIIAVVSLALGFLGAYLLLGVFNKRAKREMEAEAELLKKKKEIEIVISNLKNIGNVGIDYLLAGAKNE